MRPQQTPQNNSPDIINEHKDKEIDYPALCMETQEIQYDQIKKESQGVVNSSTIRLMEIADRITERLQGGRQFIGWDINEAGEVEEKKTKRARKKKEGWTQEDIRFIEEEDEEKNAKQRRKVCAEFFMVSGDLESLRKGLAGWIFGGEEEGLKKKKKKSIALLYFYVDSW